MSDSAHPLDLHRDRVTPDLLDYNGHMNVAGYMVMFDRAADVLFALAGYTAEFRARTRQSVFALEHHIRYLRELKPEMRVVVRGRFLAADAKRLHYFMWLVQEPELWEAATLESVSVHVDLVTRRGLAIPPEIAAPLAALIARQAAHGVPKGLGRAVAMPSRTPRAGVV